MSSKTAAPSTDENTANVAFEETQEQEYQQILTTLCEMAKKSNQQNQFTEILKEQSKKLMPIIEQSLSIATNDGSTTTTSSSSSSEKITEQETDEDPERKFILSLEHLEKMEKTVKKQMENDKKTDKVVMENLTLMLNSIEEQKKIIKAEQEKKQKALNDAIENAKKLNEKEMQRHQLGHYKKDIIDNFNKLRKNISLLNEETKDECFKQLMDFYTELKAMNNPIIINAIISPFMSVFVYYHFKLGLLQFKFLEKDEQIENRYNDLQLKVFLIDIAKTLQGGDYDSNDVSIRFTKDMLFPERLPSFENFLTKSQHDRLIKMAETILNEQKEKFLDNYETTEDKEIALLHLHAIKKGDLPCGYMNENLYETPKKTVYFIQMISPKNSEVFEKTIEKEQFDYVIEVAKERLESIEEVLKQRKNKKLTKEEQEEYDHVKSIAEGKLPFGYRLFDSNKTK